MKKINKLEILVAQTPVEKQILLDSIRVNPQMRKTFDPEDIEQLAMNIRRVGLLHPIIVNRKKKSHVYDLIAGERRYRAHKVLLTKFGKEYSRIRARSYRNLSPVLEAALQYSENSYVPVNAAEAASAYAYLFNKLRKEGYTLKGKQITIKDFSDIIGRSDSVVGDALKFVTLPDDIQLLAKQKILNYKVAVQICRIKEQEGRRTLVLRALAQKWDENKARECISEIIANRNQTTLPGLELSIQQQTQNIIDLLTKQVHYGGVAAATYLIRVLELAKKDPKTGLLRHRSVIRMTKTLSEVATEMYKHGKRRGPLPDEYKGPALKIIPSGEYDDKK